MSPGVENCKQAISCPDAKQWKEAANKEIVSLIANNTWKSVPLPPGKKAIGCGWVFKVKHNADGSVDHYKARLVAKGYSQLPGFDYTEVFAPTSRPAALRIVLALSAIEDLELHSVDIFLCSYRATWRRRFTCSNLKAFPRVLKAMLCF